MSQDVLALSPSVLESMKISGASERLGKGYKVPGAMKEWKRGGLMPQLMESCSRGESSPSSGAEHCACSCLPARQGCAAWILSKATFFSTSESGMSVPKWGDPLLPCFLIR